MTRAKPSSKSFRDFSKLLFAARQKKGWTQVELARQAHVALRTIVNVESDPATRKVRFDVIIRLAVALEQSPRLWLQTAGHSDVPDERITDVLKKSGISDLHGQEEPRLFFNRLADRLSTPQPIILCICYRTFSNFQHQQFLAGCLAPLVNRGNLFVALVCPYPKIFDIDVVSKQTLSRVYFQVRSEVIAAAKELQSAVPNANYRSHVAAFSLNGETFRDCVPPTTGLSEFRPILIQTSVPNPKGTDTKSYELCGWLTFLQDQKERLINVYPPPEKLAAFSDSFLKVCTAWQEYFSEILSSCDLTGSGWSQMKGTFGVWNKADFEIPS